jgi:hypothetical protein
VDFPRSDFGAGFVGPSNDGGFLVRRVRLHLRGQAINLRLSAVICSRSTKRIADEGGLSGCLATPSAVQLLGRTG